MAALREKELLKNLEQQIEDMLTTIDPKDLIKEPDYNMFGDTSLDIIRILCNLKLRLKQKDNQRKIQKVINRYAIEYDNMLVLKP
jgi:hypothetical protein